ncbi:TPA: tRNA pseudouridine(38-40) synthase TruA [Candidatus Dependentiae bacterium]|nr:MAG: tRNA pseudouridine synthase A [candidate division TM6 bacterium GW2011_GWF2_43_87]HBL98381.1 tRNA pseudouridine(38-40) synthase TruA [Candidatus Dependentiae bacterium]
MRSYTLVLSYDGTGYHGWQEQPHSVTVAGTLLNSYKRVFGCDASIVGASRTDAGVHALGQVARVLSPIDMDPETLRRAWNAALPHDILIRSLRSSLNDFHPHHRVIEKVYYYHVFFKKPLPIVARYGYRFPFSFDKQKFEHALQFFVGEHDFWSFCTEESPDVNSICTVNTIVLEKLPRYNALRVVIKGDRFLYRMIRRIVGSALRISATPKRSVDEIALALKERHSRHLFQTAPPQGLLLRKVRYTDPE